MPYVSEAQRRYFHWAVKNGKMDPKWVEEYDRETGDKKLPERLGIKDPKRLVKYTKKGKEKTAMFKLGFLTALSDYINQES